MRFSDKHCTRRALQQLALLTLLVIAMAFSVAARADITRAFLNMENSSNPLVLIRTSRGDIYVELFPQAAPRNVENFLALAHGQVEIPNPITGEVETPNYYDGLSFHRIVPGEHIQAGEQLYRDRGSPDYTVADEIDALALGLHEQHVLDAQGNIHTWLGITDQRHFQETVLIPLYREMGIRTEQDVHRRQQDILQRLQQMSLQQLYEAHGQRYRTGLPSRPVQRGSLAMANAGPDSNQAQFFISLLEAPWLLGKNTVIGQVVEGMQVVDEINSASAGRTPGAASRTIIYQIRQLNDGSGAAAAPLLRQ